MTDLDRFIDDYEKLTPEWTPLDRSTKYECQKCGYCCRNVGFIYLVNEDIKRISRHTGRKPAQFVSIRFFTHPTGEMFNAIVLDQFKYQDDDSLSCLFLNGDKCSIHDMRPEVCKFYPFTVVPHYQYKDEFPEHENPTIIRDGNAKFVVLYDRRCKGIGKGEPVDIHPIKKQMINHFYNVQILANNPQLHFGDDYNEILNGLVQQVCDIYSEEDTNFKFICKQRRECNIIRSLEIFNKFGEDSENILQYPDPQINQIITDWLRRKCPKARASSFSEEKDLEPSIIPKNQIPAFLDFTKDIEMLRSETMRDIRNHFDDDKEFLKRILDALNK